jgi:hypothetical protein
LNQVSAGERDEGSGRRSEGAGPGESRGRGRLLEPPRGGGVEWVLPEPLCNGRPGPIRPRNHSEAR